jgi:hypothetical protein
LAIFRRRNFWGQYILWQKWRHNQGYLYICTDTDSCLETRGRPPQSGHHDYEYETLLDSGVETWKSDWKFIPTYDSSVPPNKLPQPFPF